MLWKIMSSKESLEGCILWDGMYNHFIFGNILILWQHSDTCTDSVYATDCLQRYKNPLFETKLWYFCLSQLYHRLSQKTIVWHSSLSQLCHRYLYKRVYFPFCSPSILSIDGTQESCIVAKLQSNVTLGEQ